MSKRIIVNGDDYGYTPEKCSGILKAHRDGILTSTTVMINTVTDEQVRDLLRHAATLGIGLHLNITKGRPVSPPEAVGSLVNDKGEMARPSVWERPAWEAFGDRKVPAEVEREFRAQVELFIRRIGAPPSHLDSHHFAASHPAIFPIYLKVAESFNLPVRLPAWIHSENRFDLVPSLAAETRRRRPTTDALDTTFYCLMDDPVGAFGKALERLVDGTTEFMFHPETGKIDLPLLTDRGIKDIITRNQIGLVNFHQL